MKSSPETSYPTSARQRSLYSTLRYGIITSCLISSWALASSVPGWKQLVEIEYHLEVSGYCSLITDEVSRGYQIERTQLLNKYTLSVQERNTARGEANKLTILEWQNRGLGGFKGWCKNEGQEYAKQFSKLTEN